MALSVSTLPPLLDSNDRSEGPPNGHRMPNISKISVSIPPLPLAADVSNPNIGFRPFCTYSPRPHCPAFQPPIVLAPYDMSDSEPPQQQKVVIATHGHCFDGAASAAVLTRLLSHLGGSDLTFAYRACGYNASSNPVGASILSGHINALLDYRYTTCPNLHWYFDHHATAFANEKERQHFERHRANQRFHDPSYGSCAKLVADVAQRRFGLALPELEPLVHWAEIIDTAQFESAEQAISRDHPVLKLMTVIEHQGNAATLHRLVPRLAVHHVEQVAADSDIQRASKRLAKVHRAFVAKVRANAKPLGAVVLVDLSSENHEVVGKFITYALFPNSDYSVILTRGRSKLKISVGFNPWSKHPRRHDISTICARHGGGGHAVVGAISLPVSDIERARTMALCIATELDS